MGRNNSKPSNGSSGHVGGTRLCMLCVCDSQECEGGVGVGVNGTMLSETP